MLFEGVECLTTQGDAVNEEEDALYTSSGHEGVNQSYASAGLTGARCHDQKK